MMSAAKIILPVRVAAYEQGAMHDQFADGSFQIFDAVRLRVLDGPYEGRELTLFVDARDPAAVEAWNRPGARLRISGAADLLETEGLLFSGAATIEDVEP